MNDHHRAAPPGGEPPETLQIGSAEAGKPSYTLGWDWIDLHPELPDASVRVYRAIRMCILEKDPDRQIKLTDEEIGELTHRSRTSVWRAMKPLFALGLIEEVSTERRSVRVPGEAKPQVRTFRTLTVHDHPRGGYSSYEGPVNPFNVLKRVAAERAARERTRREARARETAAVPVADLQPQNDLRIVDNSGLVDRVADVQRQSDLHVVDNSSAVADLHKTGSTSATGPNQMWNAIEVTTYNQVVEVTGAPAPDPGPRTPSEHGTGDQLLDNAAGSGGYQGDHQTARVRVVHIGRDWLRPDSEVVDQLGLLLAIESDLTHAQAMTRAYKKLAEAVDPKLLDPQIADLRRSSLPPLTTAEARYRVERAAVEGLLLSAAEAAGVTIKIASETTSRSRAASPAGQGAGGDRRRAGGRGTGALGAQEPVADQRTG
ncbi:hypothetical protein [Saccharothrix hoggarensis]|uniref:Helix-turn-helix protein n=1 Tax=Saccharothrix hoggarensis TaxID=913853 RepID=A0ABW3QNG1_9PSEU